MKFGYEIDKFGIKRPVTLEAKMKEALKAEESWKKASEAQKRANVRSRQLHKELRIKAIEYLGGKCSRCHETFPHYVYDFHHLDPKIKDRAAVRSKDWKILLKELNKCVLLCSNCHRITHAEMEEAID